MSIGEILLRSRYQPLKRVLSYDVFNTGFNGWMTLMPNFTEYPDFDVPKTLVNKDQWPPVMLSSATFRYPGTHGAMSGTYSLKLSTRPVAAPYTEIPAEGCLEFHPRFWYGIRCTGGWKTLPCRNSLSQCSRWQINAEVAV